jgi:hypothetical protein
MALTRGLFGLPACLALIASLASLASLASGCAAPADAENEAWSQSEELRRYEDASSERPEVGILRMDGKYCTATLIGTRTVLTAAHCVGFAATIAAPSAPPLGTFTIETATHRITYGFHSYRADAKMIDLSFDSAVVQLDVAVSPATATPATIAAAWPSAERLTVYGYGRHGASCESTDAQLTKRKTTVPTSFPLVKATTCPGDSGGPYFRGASNEIVATVKGDFAGLEWVFDAVKHRDWILARRAESERGMLTPE